MCVARSYGWYGLTNSLSLSLSLSLFSFLPPSQTLALFALIAAAVCQGDVSRSRVVPRSLVPNSQTYSAAGWVIFLSFWVMLYQLLAITQLFIRVKLLYKVIEIITWSIFFLVVSTINYDDYMYCYMYMTRI